MIVEYQPGPTHSRPDPPTTLAQVEATWKRWFAGKDLYPLHAVLGTIAANHLPGDPVWLMLVGGSGTGKTEAVLAGNRIPHTHPISLVTGPAALLSATPKKDRTGQATGGVLRQVGDFGIIAIKDFTSTLSMHREARAEVLSALREVYDGAWDRLTGSEGGQVLSWSGKVGMVAGCTSVIDSAHAFISSMGDRWLMARMPDLDRHDQSHRSIGHAGREGRMHSEIQEAVAGLFRSGPPHQAPELTETEVDCLVILADLASLARSPVQRDYRGEIELVLDPEAPTRIAKQLAQLYRGLRSVGLDRATTWTTVARAGLDCIPKLRRAVIHCLDSGGQATTTTVAEAVEHPTTTTRRALEDLAAHRVVLRTGGGQGKADLWSLTPKAAAALQAIRTFSETSEGATGDDRFSPDFPPSKEFRNIEDDKTEKVAGVQNGPLGRKRCPVGHRCNQPPSGSLVCCGQPEAGS